jgi:hypothetical protein
MGNAVRHRRPLDAEQAPEQEGNDQVKMLAGQLHGLDFSTACPARQARHRHLRPQPETSLW